MSGAPTSTGVVATPAPPAKPVTQVFTSRLAAPPEAVWAHVQHSPFIAGYLGLHMPAQCWSPGQRVTGLDRAGQALVLTVLEVQPPTSLAFELRRPDQTTRLALLITAQTRGSRLTLLDEPTPPTPPTPPTTQTPPTRHTTASGNDGPAQPLTHDLANGLAAPPAAALLAGPPDRFASPALRQAALAYLADSATLVDALRQRMAAGQGYARPEGGGFSLVQHLWHLADVEQFGWAQRFARLLAEANPQLPGVDGDRLATERRYQQRPWRAAARRFVAQRRQTLAALARCDGAVLARAVHFSGQASTGADMLAALLAHDHEHRNDMARLWPPATP